MQSIAPVRIRPGRKARGRVVDVAVRGWRDGVPTRQPMKLRKLLAEDRAVSPVIGVALLIAIAVVLAAVIGVVVLGIGTGGADVPQAQLSAQNSSGTLVITHDGGEALSQNTTVLVANDTRHSDWMDDMDDGTLTTGQETETPASGSVDRVVILWEDPDSDASHVIEEFDAPEI